MSMFYRQVPCEDVLYRVQPGDAFYSIAQQFGVSLESLMRANPQIINPSLLYPGQIVCVPVRITCPKEIDGFIYHVQPGDTLFGIAQKYNVTVQDILNVNPYLTDPNLIFPGQRLCVPRPQVVNLPCCTVLKPLPNTDLTDFAKGTALIQTAPDNEYAVVFAAVGLPSPFDLGDFDGYIGSIFISSENLTFSTVLTQAVAGDQPVTWAGARIIRDNPQSPDNILTVRAYNSQTGALGSILLRSFVGSCR